MNAEALIRLPLFAFLKIVEPLVRIALGLLAFCGVIAAFFFRFFTDVPNFPFWGMLSAAVGCALLLMGYLNVVRWLSR